MVIEISVIKWVFPTRGHNIYNYSIDFPENKGIRLENGWYDGYDYNLFINTLSDMLAVKEEEIRSNDITLEMDENGQQKFVSESLNIMLHLSEESFKFWKRKRIIDDVC